MMIHSLNEPLFNPPSLSTGWHYTRIWVGVKGPDLLIKRLFGMMIDT